MSSVREKMGKEREGVYDYLGDAKKDGAEVLRVLNSAMKKGDALNALDAAKATEAVEVFAKSVEAVTTMKIDGANLKAQVAEMSSLVKALRKNAKRFFHR